MWNLLERRDGLLVRNRRIIHERRRLDRALARAYRADKSNGVLASRRAEIRPDAPDPGNAGEGNPSREWSALVAAARIRVGDFFPPRDSIA